jgi:predicted nucleotidyltransferase
MGEKLTERYRKVATQFARRVTAVLDGEVDSLVLYGSVARGEARRESDIDILVVSPDPEIIRDRLSAICEDVIYECGYALLISIVHLSREDLRWHFRVASPFIRNVVDEGVMLYDTGIFSRLREEATAASR